VRDAQEGLISQCLEWNADCFALGNLIDVALRRAGTSPPGGIFADLHGSVSHMLFAVYALWRVFATEMTVIPALAEYSHLPPRLRQLANASLIGATFEDENIVFSSSPETWGRIAGSIDQAFNEMTGIANRDPPAEWSDERAVEHIWTVAELWREVHPILVPLARFDGLPLWTSSRDRSPA
jgi:hypothetical protein